jgi:hypothetical protein
VTACIADLLMLNLADAYAVDVPIFMHHVAQAALLWLQVELSWVDLFELAQPGCMVVTAICTHTKCLHKGHFFTKVCVLGSLRCGMRLQSIATDPCGVVTMLL